MPLTTTSPSKPKADFDPRALLDPRNKSRPQSRTKSTMEKAPAVANGEPSTSPPHGQQSSDQQTDQVTNATQQPTLQREDSNKVHRRMLEKMYGVEARTEQPRKKVKLDNDIRDDPRHSAKFNSSGTGIIGDYMKSTEDPDAPTKPMPMPAKQNNGVVDLTAEDDDDDDDIQITGSNNLLEKEVFFGQIFLTVEAYVIPKPKVKTNSALAVAGQWPPISCNLLRRDDDKKNKNNIIAVLDPHEKRFANLEPHVSKALAPLLDGLPKLRTQARLLNRQMLPTEWVHQPCSSLMKMSLGLYGRKCDAEKVGRHLGHYNVWLVDSSMKDKDIETVNPHKDSVNIRKQYGAPKTHTRANLSYQDATEEEAAQTVAKIFEHHASEKIKETDAPAGVLTPLLSHQKQALTFMLRHEEPPTFGDEASGNSTLWAKKIKKNGTVYYEEAVSNLVYENQPPPVSLGGLLADVMGLGKTLESLTLIAATAKAAQDFGKAHLDRSKDEGLPLDAQTKGTLIVCPMSTVANWETQISEHLDKKAFKWYTHHGQGRIRNPQELRNYDIVITTYGTLQSEARRQGDGVLRALKWFRIILDEAHTIREPSAQQSQACYELAATRRWCLTGTPIQNKLADLGSLCQFLRLYPYDTVKDFQHYIGKRAGSGDDSFLLKLRIFIDSFTLRRQRDQIDLPEREDLVVAVEFSKSERKLHDFFRERAQITVAKLTKSEGPKKDLQVSVLQGITILRLISAHGRDLLREDDYAAFKGGVADEPIDLDEEVEPPSMTRLQAYELYKMMSDAGFDTCRNCDTAISGSSPLPESDADATQPRCVVLPCRDLVCGPCFRQYKPVYNIENQEHVVCPLCFGTTASTYQPITGIVSDEIEMMQVSRENSPGVQDRYTGPHSKTRALIADITQMKKDSKELEANGEPPLKCVIFSEFTSHLNLIARGLSDHGKRVAAERAAKEESECVVKEESECTAKEEPEREPEPPESWKTVRIDGSMSLSKRKKVLEALATDNDITILLASIKAAGQGLNLTSASRAFIMEPLWNPAAEAQAVDRIYRIGQKRPVVVKRYHMKDSIEEAIMTLAEKKQKLADLSMNRNHKQLSKKEIREQHYNEIRALFEGKKGR